MYECRILKGLECGGEKTGLEYVKLWKILADLYCCLLSAYQHSSLE